MRGRQYIFVNYANILVEAGNETFVREKRDRCLRRYSELFSILSRQEEESDFSDFISRANVVTLLFIRALKT